MGLEEEEEDQERLLQQRRDRREMEAVGESDGNLDRLLEEEESLGGYSPPAWRRLENGSRTSGFWRGGGNKDNIHIMRHHHNQRHHRPHESRHASPSLGLMGDAEIDKGVLEQAMRTRLPAGSASPEKGRSPEPERPSEDDTLVERIKRETTPSMKHMDSPERSMMSSMSPEAARDNCRS